MLKKIIFSIVAIVLLIWAFTKLSSNKKAIDDAASYLEVNENIPVQTIKVTRSTYSDQLGFTGTFKAIREVNFGAEMQGKINEIFAEEGEFLPTGKLIAKIDTDLLEVKLRGEEAQLTKATDDLERYKNLMKDSATSDIQLKQIRLNHTMAQIAVSNSKKQIEKSLIKAPIKGYLTVRNFDKGSIVAPGSPIGTITDISAMKFIAMIPEHQIVLIKEGATVKVFADIYPDSPFEGEISNISVRGDQNHNFKVEVMVQNNNGGLPLKAGMYGRLVVESKNEVTNFLVPRSAFLNETGTAKVFLVKNGIAKLTEVRRGNFKEDQVSVISGLNENDEVIVTGVENLTDGVTVNISK